MKHPHSFSKLSSLPCSDYQRDYLFMGETIVSGVFEVQLLEDFHHLAVRSYPQIIVGGDEDGFSGRK